MKRRFLNKFFHDKRAVTPVLSNVLLMVVAVAAMSVAATAAYLISDNLHNIMGERLIIEDVWFKGNNEIRVYLRNVGKVDLEISAVYINHTSVSFTKLKLRVDEGGWINITQAWTQGELFHINIVTERGNRVEEYYKAPS